MIFISVNSGKDFENQIRDSVKKCQGIYYLRIEDPPQSFNPQENSVIRFSNKNPYDFWMYRLPYLYTIECKSKNDGRLSFSLDKKNKNVDIKAHQIDGLMESFKFGAISGFFLNFRNKETTYFLHILDFLKFVKDTLKKSINEEDVKQYGGIVIPQEKKKVKFNFDIEYIMKVCEENYEKGDVWKLEK